MQATRVSSSAWRRGCCDGDRLYPDVIENKDPLFFYTYAAALWIGGWRGPFLLDGVWLASRQRVGIALLVRALGAPRSAVVASFFVYPAGTDERLVPRGHVDARRACVRPARAVALAPRAIRRRGVAVVVVMLLKLNLAPLAAAPIGALLVLGAPDRASLGARSTRGALGWADARAAAAILGPSTPSSEPISSRSRTTSTTRARARPPTGRSVALREHLDVAWSTSAAPVAGSTARCSRSDGVRRSRRSRLDSSDRGRIRLLGAVAAATLASALLVVAHDRVLVRPPPDARVPATLVAATSIWRADASVRPRQRGRWRRLCVLSFAVLDHR